MAETFSWAMTTKPRTKTMHRKSVRWLNSEMVKVDGLLMAYDLDDDNNILVRFPGGNKVPLVHLQQRGHRVVPPSNIRSKEYL